MIAVLFNFASISEVFINVIQEHHFSLLQLKNDIDKMRSEMTNQNDKMRSEMKYVYISTQSLK